MKDWITYKYRVYKINFNVICNDLKIYLFDRIDISYLEYFLNDPQTLHEVVAQEVVSVLLPY